MFDEHFLYFFYNMCVSHVHSTSMDYKIISNSLSIVLRSI
jgi:hypothetical protein